MILPFDPQNVEEKEKGRVALAKAAGLPLEDAAPFFTAATHTNFQTRYNKFAAAYPTEARVISDSRSDGIGPGEMVAWFVFDNITLGGKNASIDLYRNGAPFAEMKGGPFSKSQNTVSDFKLSKDGDDSVVQVLSDLAQFNTTYRRLTGQDLTGWAPAEVGKTSLDLWAHVDLSTMANGGARREAIHLSISPNGDVLDAEGQRLTHVHAEDLARKMVEIAQSEWKIPVDSKVATLQKIVHRWRAQVFEDYLDGKNLALIDAKTLQMMFFGQLTEDMIGLHRIHRNQPWARIYLP